ncbi:MAG: hypothetical protein H6719_31800 [Sandaracinaceae bacterium]|nr:hypothetical protein [Sandaracinaceae bacterium]
MADLEKDAFKRDGRFLWRLVLVLVVGTLAGVWMFAELTGERVAGCAANAFGGVTTAPASE